MSTLSTDKIIPVGSTLTVSGNLSASGIVSGTGGVVPIGGIIMWSGTIASIPNNWKLCDGNFTTPDLRDKFIIGAFSDSSGAKTNVTGTLTVTGGSKNSDLQAHTHTATVTDLGHTHNVLITKYVTGNVARSTLDQISSDASTTTFATTGATTGISVSNASNGTGDGTNANLPPYYALAFIMRTA